MALGERVEHYSQFRIKALLTVRFFRFLKQKPNMLKSYINILPNALQMSL